MFSVRGSFDDTVGNSDLTTSDDQIINDYKFERMRKETHDLI